MIGTCEHEGLLFGESPRMSLLSNLPATLGPNHFDAKGVEKLLALVITEENHANAEELRKEGRELYLKDIHEDDKAKIASAFVRVGSYSEEK